MRTKRGGKIYWQKPTVLNNHPLMTNNISIVFASSADFTIPVLEALIADERYSVDLVLTNPPRPVGRKQVLTKTAIHILAQKNNLTVATPETKKKLTAYVEAQDWQPDFMVVMAYGMIVQEPVLNWAKYAPVNGHLSILPSYRGASPVQAALLNGDLITGNTYIKMDKGMDTGPVFRITGLPIETTDTAQILLNKLGKIAAKDFPELLPEIKSGLSVPVDQVGEATTCSKIKKQAGEITFSDLTAKQIINRFRAYYPWPGIFFFDEDGIRQIVRSIEFEPGDFPEETNDIFVESGACYFRCKEDFVGLKEIQTAGKSVCSGKDWFNGYMASKKK